MPAKKRPKTLFRTPCVTSSSTLRLSRPAPRLPPFFITLALLAVTLIFGLLLFALTIPVYRQHKVDTLLEVHPASPVIYAPFDGVVLGSHVTAGEQVESGQLMLAVGERRAYSDGGIENDKAIRRFDAELDALMQQRQAEQAQRDALSQRLKVELANAEDDLGRQRVSHRYREVAQEINREESQRYKTLATANHIAPTVANQQALALSQSQAMVAESRRSLQTTRFATQRLQANYSIDVSRADAKLAQIDASIQRVRRERAIFDRQTRVQFAATLSGQVATMHVTEGMQIKLGQALLQLMPSVQHYSATLWVADDIARLLPLGHALKVRLAAYPYMQHGSIDAEVTAIARAAIPNPSSLAWRVDVRIVKPTDITLSPGMRLTAVLKVPNNKRVIDWILDPLPFRLAIG